jgi:hypothetical protein
MTIRRIACGRTMFVPYLSAGRLYRVSPQLLVRSFPPSTSVPFSLPAVSYAHIESIVQRILLLHPVCLQEISAYILYIFLSRMALEPNTPGVQVRRSYLIPATPGYNTASMEMQPQPSPAFTAMPLCHEEDGRTSTTPTRESFPKKESLERKHPRIVRWSRIGLCVSRIAVSVLLVAASAAIVGCEGHALRNFNVTNLGAQFFLPLWPQQLDLTPTITILAVGGVILTFNLIYLISAAIPYVCPLFPVPYMPPITLQETLCLLY